MRSPVQVFYSVVRLDIIFVSNNRKIIWIWYERLRYKFMNTAAFDFVLFEVIYSAIDIAIPVVYITAFLGKFA